MLLPRINDLIYTISQPEIMDLSGVNQAITDFFKGGIIHKCLIFFHHIKFMLPLYCFSPSLLCQMFVHSLDIQFRKLASRGLDGGTTHSHQPGHEPSEKLPETYC